MPILTKTILLLLVSNVFMLTAWYFHLKHLMDRPWYIAALLSWFIAFFRQEKQVRLDPVAPLATAKLPAP